MESEEQQQEESLPKRRRRHDDNSSESDSDAELTYEQYLKEVQRKESENDGEDEYKEDIYGRRVNKKTGKVVSFDIRGAHKKLEDLDAKGGDNESKMKIDRVLMGTLNRLSEGTLIRSCQAVAEVWQNNSKNDSYKALRKLHWSGFSEELSKISSAVETAVFSALPRAKFLGETLMSLQKSPPTNVDMSVIEHYLKLFHGMRKKGNLVYDKELGMSLDDLLHADERGRWWVVGSAYRLANDGATVGGNVGASTQSAGSFPEEIVQLARRAKMNTEVRRNIFCTVGELELVVWTISIVSLFFLLLKRLLGLHKYFLKFYSAATSDDEDSAFERLVRLSLKGQQEREIIYVLIMMSLKEKNFNAFYPMLIGRFCDFDKRFVLTTQYALWDRIREVDSLKLRARTRLADLIHHLISNEVLPITILKVVEWGTLTAGVSSVIRRVFKLLSSSSVTKVRRVFAPLFVSKDKNSLLIEGLRLFLNVNFPDSEVYTKIEESLFSS
ncbi:MA3 domain protein [Teladorsagia circumcincta]|uniref:MA3 domain protein n=1 Tax=Teladorsagia circumcincta TaxID=45464 RepID=A0A2G9TRU3_TELCI|nr:MA3 domain protein [Teladorsagia circumcincta]